MYTVLHATCASCRSTNRVKAPTQISLAIPKFYIIQLDNNIMVIFTNLLIISHRSSIKFPSPIIIGPASAMIRALGCTTVLLPESMHKHLMSSEHRHRIQINSNHWHQKIHIIYLNPINISAVRIFEISNRIE